ncbi:hypothetical protein [Achromobacter sp. DH1f]|uniref:hypothetical protein n=1 Tax=Achromobacter sp. DH1f TaxID=1397275 RepID=UPI000469B2B1|nr:hypothetical protein [Achromobacter sp. DH1f]
MLGVFASKNREIIISNSEIDAAMAHLRAMPHRSPMPPSWDRQRFLNQLRAAVGSHPKVDHHYAVAPGVYAILMPFGCDRLGAADSADDRLQAWLLIRPMPDGTDRLTTL